MKNSLATQINQTPDEGKTIEITGTTAFVDEAPKVSGRRLEATSEHTGITPVQSEQRLADFMAKPYMVESFTWSGASGADTALKTYSIAALMEANGYWNSKLEGYNLVRGTAVLRVQMNAQPFIQGRLLLHFLPFKSHLTTAQITTKNLNLCAKTQQPNIEIDCRDGVGEIRIPYVSPTYWYDRYEDQFDWGSVYITVLDPFATGSNGSTSVDLTVWLHFEDFEFAAPTYPQMAAKKLKTKSTRAKGVAPVDKENSVLQRDGTISQALSSVSKAATTLSGIPLISSIMAPVAWATDIGSKVASMLGYSKPDYEGGLDVIKNDPLAYAINSSGVVPSTNLGLSAVNKIAVSENFAGTDIDEMSLKYLSQIPAWFSTDEWDTSDATDALIIDLDLIPADMYITSTVVSGTATYTVKNYPPVTHLTNYFMYYRGGIKVTLKFVKTDFHSGRLLVTYNPTAAAVGTTVAESQLAHRDIIDIRECSEYTFTLPYMHGSSWLGRTTSLGTLSVRVLNELRVPETCSSGISILTYISGAEDFEYAVPANPQSYPIVAQMDVNLNDTTMGVDKYIGSSSLDDYSTDHHTLCIGEMIGSIKELMLRSTVVNWGSVDYYTNGFYLYPFTFNLPWPTLNSTATTVPVLGYDILPDFVSAFALFRGSMHYEVANTETGNGNFALSLLQVRVATPLASNSITGPTNAGVNTYRAIPWVIPNNNYNVASIKVPYYSRTRSTIVRFDDTNTLVDTIDQPLSLILGKPIGTPSATKNILRRSIADDFQLGYFTGFPCIFLTAA